MPEPEMKAKYEGMMEKMATPGHKRGRQSEIVGYILEQPTDRHITIAELEKRFKNQYTRMQIMATMAHVCGPKGQEYHIPIKRITQGVWQALSANGHKPVQEELPIAEPTPPTSRVTIDANTMLVEILKEKETYFLVEDQVDGKIYKMILVG